jgi:deoxyribodipyrimidine photo-lyase
VDATTSGGLPLPEPSRVAGLLQLRHFAPAAGRAYAEGRNTDLGPGRPTAVSALSPYVRHRLVTEAELVAAAQAEVGPEASASFVQEVFWRSYWKGWLELRPGIWPRYQNDLLAAEATLAVDRGLRARHAAAVAGRTGLAPFDAWVEELQQRHWLHNHARMWFASIWCFTLRLPWQLGADLFLRHLLDGDAASNTLSWRWVAGTQTRGKHYVARAETIARYTGGRFHPAGQLDEAPEPILEALNRATDAVLKEPEVAERVRGFGADPIGGSRAFYAEAVRQDWRRWGEVVRDLNLRPD